MNMHRLLLTIVFTVALLSACNKNKIDLVSKTNFAFADCDHNYSTVEDDDSLSNLINMKFVYIKPGTFIMGIPPGYGGAIGGKNPSHLVSITQGYYLQSTEVTQEQWFNVTGETPSYFEECGACCPVENVSWEDVQDFIMLLNIFDEKYRYRLPTEAEWEYAARSGIDGPYSFGRCLTSFHANIYQAYGQTETSTRCESGRSYGKTIPVASLEMNSWGLYDMYGNVAEWCQDFFGERPELHKHVIDPIGPENGFGRVIRGGSWGASPTASQSGYASYSLQNNPNYYTGFRLIAIPKSLDN